MNTKQQLAFFELTKQESPAVALSLNLMTAFAKDTDGQTISIDWLIDQFEKQGVSVPKYMKERKHGIWKPETQKPYLRTDKA